MIDSRPWAPAGGYPTAGIAVGILCLDTRHPLLPGNVQHAGSYGFPVAYQVVETDDPWRLMRGDPALLPPILAAARALQQLGVRAICGACGSFGFYQKAVADALDIPVILSPLMLAPLVLTSMPATARLGVVCGSAELIDARLLAACGIVEPARLAYAPLSGKPCFEAMVSGCTTMDVEAMRGELLGAARTMLADATDVRALLLQCSDVPPFAADLQQATGLPIFDMVRLIRMIGGAVDCRAV